MTNENVDQTVVESAETENNTNTSIEQTVPWEETKETQPINNVQPEKQQHQEDDPTISDLGVSTVGGGTFTVLPADNYDAIIHGIVFCGQQPNNFKDNHGNPQPPSAIIRLIVELPSQLKESDQTTITMGTDVTLSVGEKGNWTPIVSAILNKKMTKEDMAKYVFSTGLKELLGKAVVAGVVNEVGKDNKNRAYLDRKGFHPLDPRLPKPIPTRETFFFNPFKPDIKIFEETLTAWTRKQVMSAVNVESFAPELKQSWLKMQVIDAAAEEARKQPNKAVPASANTNAIE